MFTLAKSKLTNIDTLISQALIVDMDISHEEFITILKEKDRFEMMKDNLRNKNGETYDLEKKPKKTGKYNTKILLSFLYY